MCLPLPRPEFKVRAIDGLTVTVEITHKTDPLNKHDFIWGWGDNSITKDDADKIKHTYKAAGSYLIDVYEQCPWYVFKSRQSNQVAVTVPSALPDGLGAPVSTPDQSAVTKAELKAAKAAKRAARKAEKAAKKGAKNGK